MSLSWEGNWGKYYWIVEQVLEWQEQQHLECVGSEPSSQLHSHCPLQFLDGVDHSWKAPPDTFKDQHKEIKDTIMWHRHYLMDEGKCVLQVTRTYMKGRSITTTNFCSWKRSLGGRLYHLDPFPVDLKDSSFICAHCWNLK